MPLPKAERVYQAKHTLSYSKELAYGIKAEG